VCTDVLNTESVTLVGDSVVLLSRIPAMVVPGTTTASCQYLSTESATNTDPDQESEHLFSIHAG